MFSCSVAWRNSQSQAEVAGEILVRWNAHAQAKMSRRDWNAGGGRLGTEWDCLAAYLAVPSSLWAPAWMGGEWGQLLVERKDCERPGLCRGERARDGDEFVLYVLLVGAELVGRTKVGETRSLLNRNKSFEKNKFKLEKRLGNWRLLQRDWKID